MFGFSLAAQIFQGSAQRTWDCVTQFSNLLWYKFNHIRHPIMPRSRRRHHSRSRSRSRSHSPEKDREVKRRKIDSLESPIQKRSVSSEPEEVVDTSSMDEEMASQEIETNDSATTETPSVSAIASLETKLKITPSKTMSPKQQQKKLESEKKRQQKQEEREEREKKKLEEKERARLEKIKQKEERQKKTLEKEELKRKEKEEKEAKRKEKEEKEEQKRKEKEQEKMRKQQEIDEKKQKEEEKKIKAAAVFTKFFVAKKSDAEKKLEEQKSSLFMPFQVKSDMRLAPPRRPPLTEDEKSNLSKKCKEIETGASFLKDLKNGKVIGRCGKTWPFEDDCVIVEEDFGETICEDQPKLIKIRSKYLQFHANRRPAYFGTWRKKSSVVKPRRPFAEDKTYFDYEVESDDDWEEEEQGESLNGSDDEEKEVENDDYEVDNEFFVPHGHLSDDEVDDEPLAKLSPESHKQKLKLLKDTFDEDMRVKTNRINPRSIGCIWYNKDGSCADEANERHLKPFAMITNGVILVKKRSREFVHVSNRKPLKELNEEFVPTFLKMIHGRTTKKKIIVQKFFEFLEKNGHGGEFSKTALGKTLKLFAHWRKCTEEGPRLNQFCWCVDEEVMKKYNVESSISSY